MLVVVLGQKPPILGIIFSIGIRTVSIDQMFEVCFQMCQFCLEVEKILVIEFAELSEDGEFVVVAHHRRDLGVALVSYCYWQ